MSKNIDSKIMIFNSRRHDEWRDLVREEGGTRTGCVSSLFRLLLVRVSQGI